MRDRWGERQAQLGANDWTFRLPCWSSLVWMCPEDMEGPAIKGCAFHRDTPGAGGRHYLAITACHVCVTDGRYVYMRAGPQNPENRPFV